MDDNAGDRGSSDAPYGLLGALLLAGVMLPLPLFVVDSWTVRIIAAGLMVWCTAWAIIFYRRHAKSRSGA